MADRPPAAAPAPPRDAWDSGADYEAYMGRWSGPVAESFVGWLAVPAGGSWLDFGCGTGALSRAVLAHAAPRRLLGCDRSAAFAAWARRRTTDPRTAFVAATAPGLPCGPGRFDAAVSGLVLNFVPAPVETLAALAACTRPGATVAVYVWDYAGRMEFLRAFWDAATALDPAAAALDEGPRFPLCAPGPLRAALEASGLEAVELAPIEVPTVFRDFADLWQPFLAGQGPAPGYVRGLDPAARTRLHDALAQRLGARAGGSIALVARAWAAKGRVRGAAAHQDRDRP